MRCAPKDAPNLSAGGSVVVSKHGQGTLLLQMGRMRSNCHGHYGERRSLHALCRWRHVTIRLLGLHRDIPDRYQVPLPIHGHALQATSYHLGHQMHISLLRSTQPPREYACHTSVSAGKG